MRRRTVWLLVAAGFGALLRAVSAGFLPSLPHDAAVFFLPDARVLAEHGLLHWAGLSPANPPLFPVLTALVGKIAPNLEVAAISLSVMSGALIVWPALSVAEFLFPGKPDVHGATLCLTVCHPFLIRFASEPVADAMYALMFAHGFRAGLGFILHPRFGPGVRLGGWVGAGYLLRPEILGLPALATTVVVAARWLPRASWRQVAFGMMGVGIAVAPALLCNMVFVHERIGVWTLSPKAGVLVNFEKLDSLNSLATLNPAKTMTLHEEALSSDRSYQRFSWDEFSEIGWWPRWIAFLRNLSEFGRYLVESGHPVVFGLAVFGAWCWWGRGSVGTWRNGGIWVVVGTLSSYAFVLSIFYVSRRFLLPFLPLVVPWAAAGLVHLQAWLGRRWRVPRWCVLGVTLGVLLAGSVDRLGWIEARWRQRPEQELGERIRARHGSGQIIVSAKGRVTWYAGGRHLFLPAAGLEDIVAYMRNRGARLLVLEERRRHRNEHLEKALASDPRWREADVAQGRETTYRLFELMR
ncbi:MAG: hypothetical protein AB7O52_06730 [Planctomycetota bacterium]